MDVSTFVTLAIVAIQCAEHHCGYSASPVGPVQLLHNNILLGHAYVIGLHVRSMASEGRRKLGDN